MNLVISRIKELLDNDSNFLEIGKFADKSIVCGIGRVSNQVIMLIANNPEIKAGCYFPSTIKKQIRAQQIAINLKLPCIYLIDSAGLYLPAQAECFATADGFGKIFYQQAKLRNNKIPQIAIVFGACVAGGAYIPAMADEIIMIDKLAKMFLAGPHLVAAATKEQTDAETLGGATTHCIKSGVADYFAKDMPTALNICKKIVNNINHSKIITDYTSQLYPTPKLTQLIPKDTRQPLDTYLLIQNLIDIDSFNEFKANYARSIITGTATIAKFKVAIIANNGVLMTDSANKTKQFIDIVSNRNLPIIFIQNITGFMVGTRAETSGIIKAGAELIHSMSSAQTSKITLMINHSYGAGNYAMCGRAFEPDFIWSWPGASTAVMGAQQAYDVLSKLKHSLPDNPAEFINHYNYNSSAQYAATQLWHDGIIQPEDTRNVLIHSLVAIYSGVTCANS